MKEFQITYQQTPYHYTKPESAIVKANSKEEAFVLLYDKLSRAGRKVDTSGRCLKEAGLDPELVASFGVSHTYGDVHIGTVEPYGVRLPEGKVI